MSPGRGCVESHRHTHARARQHSRSLPPSLIYPPNTHPPTAPPMASPFHVGLQVRVARYAAPHSLYFSWLSRSRPPRLPPTNSAPPLPSPLPPSKLSVTRHEAPSLPRPMGLDVPLPRPAPPLPCRPAPTASHAPPQRAPAQHALNSPGRAELPWPCLPSGGFLCVGLGWGARVPSYSRRDKCRRAPSLPRSPCEWSSQSAPPCT